jgi:hypothetical protein
MNAKEIRATKSPRPPTSDALWLQEIAAQLAEFNALYAVSLRIAVQRDGDPPEDVEKRRFDW